MEKNNLLSLEVGEAKRIVYLLNNHQKLISILKIPDIIKEPLLNDINSIRKILDKFEEIKEKK